MHDIFRGQWLDCARLFLTTKTGTHHRSLIINSTQTAVVNMTIKRMFREFGVSYMFLTIIMIEAEKNLHIKRC